MKAEPENHRQTLLVVDDEVANLQKLRRTFLGEYRVHEATGGREALEILKDHPVNAIITDQRMHGMSGVELLKRTLKVQPDAVRIILTGYTEVEDLMDAINEGHVHRYITKPWEPFTLQQSVKQEIRHRELKQENSRLASQLKKANQQLQRENRQLQQEVARLQRPASEFIFESSEMKQLLELVDRVVETDSTTVLIQGETGTGKELMARYIHHKSGRCEGPFVPVNCGAISADLVVSAFFGHRKGSFTGATSDSKGFFGQADTGTIFLDEIGDAPLDLQVKLLRVLQEGEILPVGETRARRIDVRVVASTNRRLDEMVDEGVFRQDLFFRLNVFSVTVPPLRARRADIEVLARHFLATARSRMGKAPVELADTTLKLLRSYSWPGNVRELENEMERVAILCQSEPEVSPSYLAERIRYSRIRSDGEERSLKDQLWALERRLILEGLAAHGNNKSQAAQTLGITRQTIISKLKQYQDR